MSSPLPQKAFVTGASVGIGRAVAQLLVARGVETWGTARSLTRLEPLVASGGGRFHAVELDLASGEATVAAYRGAAAASGGFDLIVNNAGYGCFGEFAATDFGAWESQLAAMLTHTVRLVHTQMGDLLAAGRGTLVNVSSLATEFPLPFMSGYNIAKAGLSALSESLLVEIAGRGVVLIDFRPGDHRTEFNRSMHPVSSLAAAAPTANDSRRERVWQNLERHLEQAPPADRAARDLWRAVRRGRSGVVRSGEFFQTILAPLGARILPRAWFRALRWRYFGLS